MVAICLGLNVLRHINWTVCWGWHQRDIKLHITDPLWWKSTGDWWIPLTKGQPVMWKAFLWHEIIMSSHLNPKCIYISIFYSLMMLKQYQFLRFCLGENKNLSISWRQYHTWQHMTTINSSLPGQNGHHFTYDIFKCSFMNKKICTLIPSSLDMMTCLNKRLSKQWRSWWFETLSRPLWCHRNEFVLNHIMAGRAFVVAKEVFTMETVVFWHCDNGWIMKNNSFGANSAMSIIICTLWLILIT